MPKTARRQPARAPARAAPKLPAPKERRSSPGPAKQVRGEKLVENVLEATVQELARVGYETLAIEQVAERAGVNKVTLYRRWPTKRDLVGAALRKVVDDVPDAPPDTGSLRGDILELLHVARELVRAPTRQALFRLLFARSGDDLTELCEAIRSEKDAECFVVYQRAIARGELAANTNVALVHSVLFGTVLNRVLFEHEDCDVEEIEEIANIVLYGAAAGARGAPAHAPVHAPAAPNPKRRKG